MTTPALGQIVLYRHEDYGYKLPAIVTATIDTVTPQGVERGDYPNITDPDVVHLHVFTPQTVAQYQARSVPLGTDNGQWVPLT